MKKFIFSLLVVTLILAGSQTTSHAATKTVVADTRAFIAPLLELSISQEGQSELRFGNIRPSAIDTIEAGPIAVLIEVRSNTGNRYQITQTINSALVNAEGNQMSFDQLKFKTTSSKLKGSTIDSPTPVSASSQIIYTSDAEGASDTITAAYTLTVPPSQAPGDYSALLTYTVSSL